MPSPTQRFALIHECTHLMAALAPIGTIAPMEAINELVAECPQCGAMIKFKSAPLLHELVRCPECGAELEVVSLEPLTLALAPIEEEDWGE